MKMLKLFNLIFPLLLLTFSFIQVRAQEDIQPEDPRPPIDRREQQRRPNLLQELGLSREQIQQIRRINQSKRPLMMEAQRRFHEANRALDEVIYSDSPNEAEVQARMKEVQLAQAEIIKIRTQSEFEIRRILTPEQLVKFRDLRRRFMQRMQQNQPPDKMNEPQQPPPNDRPFLNPNRQNPDRPARRGF